MNFMLSFDFMVINNESLDLGTRNLVCRHEEHS